MVVGRPAGQLEQLAQQVGIDRVGTERLVGAARTDSLLDVHAVTLEAAPPSPPQPHRARERRPELSVAEIVCIALAGMAAGTINTVVGSGTLITFPVLLAFGYSPVTANVSNTIGLVPGVGLGRDRLPRASSPASARARCGSAPCRSLGGVTGAVLLLVLPASAFKAIVPAFIAIALVLAVLQPRINALARAPADRAAPAPRTRLTAAAVYLTGVYGGYFGAAQGILLLAILGVALDQDLQRTNALKNVLAGLVNGVAGIYFVFVAHVAWGPAARDRRRGRSSEPSSARATAGGCRPGRAARADRRGRDRGDRPADRRLSAQRNCW